MPCCATGKCAISTRSTTCARPGPRMCQDLAYVNVIYLGGDQLYPAYDMAIRIWARKASAVAAAVGRIDEAWIGILKELFSRPGVDETEALVRARINYFHQVGYYALAVKESIEERARLVPLLLQDSLGPGALGPTRLRSRGYPGQHPAPGQGSRSTAPSGNGSIDGARLEGDARAQGGAAAPNLRAQRA